MKLVALMLARNEAWILRASLDAALRWADHVVLLNHASTDSTRAIAATAANATKRVTVGDWMDGEHWLEMDARQSTLEIARGLGATHIAITDADEILTHNNIAHVRDWFASLAPGECLDLPMIAPWKSLDYYTRAIGSQITLGFRDKPDLAWRPRGTEQYHYHQRSPQGTGVHKMIDASGGVMHLQFANWRRFVAKHKHYMMSERVRWPMYRAKDINEKYSWWARLEHETRGMLPMWWGDYKRDQIELDGESWYEAAMEKLVAEHGSGPFAELDFTFGGKA